MTLPSVPTAQIQMLIDEGATVVPIDPLELPAPYQRPGHEHSRFRDVLSKLRVWELTTFERILVLDADTIVMKPLDGVFAEPELNALMPLGTANETDRGVKADVAPTAEKKKDSVPRLPSTYLLAASADTWGRQAEWLESSHPIYLCAYFILLKPDAQIFAYYEWLLRQSVPPFEALYPDQDLLIYAHRADGPMPWRKIPIEWSANDGEWADRSRSLHVKAWKKADGANVNGKEKVQAVRGDLLREMEAFYILQKQKQASSTEHR